MSEMKIYSQRIQNIVDHYCLFDDNFMTMFFCENYEAAELVLNIILERDDLKIIDVKVQVVEPSSKVKGRSVRLDVLAKDQQGKKYNIEVQRDEQERSLKEPDLTVLCWIAQCCILVMTILYSKSHM